MKLSLKWSSVYLVVFSMLSIMLVGCGKSSDSKKADEATQNVDTAANQIDKSGEQASDETVTNPDDLAEAMKKMGEALKGDGKAVEPVDFRQLKALLPEKFTGMTRTNASGEKIAAFGINASNAEGDYATSDGNSSIQIKITDMGSLKGITALASQAWFSTEIDRETDFGYEKTTTVSGHKAFEEYNTNDKSGKISILVSDRFIVEMNGTNIEMNALKSAAGSIDLNKLAGLK